MQRNLVIANTFCQFIISRFHCSLFLIGYFFSQKWLDFMPLNRQANESRNRITPCSFQPRIANYYLYEYASRHLPRRLFTEQPFMLISCTISPFKTLELKPPVKRLLETVFSHMITEMPQLSTLVLRNPMHLRSNFFEVTASSRLRILRGVP